MPRGGLRPNTKVESNHLFKPKWNNKKTVAIRIPEVFKDCLINLAKYLDKLESANLIKDDNYIISLIKKDSNLESNNQLNCEEYQENKEQNLNSINSQNTNQSLQKNQQNKYKLAVECFDEYLKIKNLKIEELYKSRKGTKRYQLYEINQWLMEQSKNK